MKNHDRDEIEPSWGQLFHIVRDQFPYCRMKDVIVREGAVVSFGEAQCTLVFGRGVEPPKCLLPDAFDDQWRRLRRFCQEIQDGVLGEVRFADGRPVAVSMERPGMKLGAHLSPDIIRKGGDILDKTIAMA